MQDEILSANMFPSRGVADSQRFSISVTGKSAMLSLLQDALARPDSAQISVRGPVSAIVDLVERLGDRSAQVSALISLRGDKTAR